jgi:hypothetical protein
MRLARRRRYCRCTSMMRRSHPPHRSKSRRNNNNNSIVMVAAPNVICKTMKIKENCQNKFCLRHLKIYRGKKNKFFDEKFSLVSLQSYNFRSLTVFPERFNQMLRWL